MALGYFGTILIGAFTLSGQFIQRVWSVSAAVENVPSGSAKETDIGNNLDVPVRHRFGHDEESTSIVRGSSNDKLLSSIPSSKQQPRHRQRAKDRFAELVADRLHSATNGTVESGRQAATQSEVQLRRALRQKRRKLKRLWQEIERIQLALKVASGRGPSQSDGTGRRRQPLKADIVHANVTAKMKMKKRHWRRRMMQRLKLLSRLLQAQQQKSPSKEAMEKMDALLALLQSDGKGGKSNRNVTLVGATGRHRGIHRSNKNRANHAQNSSSKSVVPAVGEGSTNKTRSKPRKDGDRIGNHKTGRRRLGGRRKPEQDNSKRPAVNSGGVSPSARTVIKKGEAGSTCTSHKNCKPGFCCHQIVTKQPQMTNATSSICVEHRFKQSQPCADSCQCDNELQCFVSRKDKLYHKRVPPPDTSPTWSTQQDYPSVHAAEDVDEIIPASGGGQCKIPAMDDVLHGVYIMADNSIFKIKG